MNELINQSTTVYTAPQIANKSEVPKFNAVILLHKTTASL